jgi:uncharacterized membrane protein
VEAQTIIRIFGYSTAGIVFVAGIIIMLGFFPSYVPDNFRVIAGIVLMLYGIYRAAMLRMNQRSPKREENEVL